MRNTSLKRIKYLITKELTISRLHYYMVGCFAVAFIFGLFTNLSFEFFNSILVVGYLNGMSLFQKESRVSDFFLLPANMKEKITSLAITWAIIFPLIISFSLVIGLFLGVKLVGKPFILDDLLIGLMVVYLFHPLMLWSNIHFRKNGLWKFLLIFAVTFLVLGIMILCLSIALEMMYPHFDALWKYMRFTDGNLWKELKIGGIIVYIFVLVSLWIASYFSLKEREI